MNAQKSDRVVVTGGRGRISRLLTAALRSRGYNAVASSRVADAEFLDYHEVTSTQFLQSAGAVLHLAWSTVPAVAERVPGIEWEVDLPYLASMLRAASRLPKDQRPHIVFFSSGGTVYGEAPSDRGSREDDLCVPIGWYGRAKVAAEELVSEFAAVFGLDCAILRVSNPYGYAMDPTKPQGLIAHLLNSARCGTEFMVWGDGGARKDYLSFADLNEAVVRILETRATGTYNLAAGESHSVNEIIDIVRQVTGREFAVSYREPFEWDIACSHLDISHIRRSIQWSPRIPIREGIAALWQTMNANS